MKNSFMAHVMIAIIRPVSAGGTNDVHLYSGFVIIAHIIMAGIEINKNVCIDEDYHKEHKYAINHIYACKFLKSVSHYFFTYNNLSFFVLLLFFVPMI